MSEQKMTTIFSMPLLNPWKDFIFPQVSTSCLLENYVVVLPQGPSPTRRKHLSSVAVQVSNLLCLKVGICAHS